MNLNELDLNELDHRLDLDNVIKKISKDFPKNEDDFFLFIRGKGSTNEIFAAMQGNEDLMIKAMTSVAIQEDKLAFLIKNSNDLLINYYQENDEN